MHVELTVGQDGAVSRESYFNGNDLFLSGPKVIGFYMAGFSSESGYFYYCWRRRVYACAQYVPRQRYKAMCLPCNPAAVCNPEG
jgi:hypothetical protein